jgi:hypothetical protein
MNKVGRIGAVLVAAVAAAGMTTVAASSPAAAAPQGPRPVSNWLRSVPANQSTWVKIPYWTNRAICNVKIWVDGGRRVDVEYPRGRSYTSFNNGDRLRPGRVDYASVLVEPNFTRSGVAMLRATISYTSCGFFGRPMRDTDLLNLPIYRNGGNWHGDGGHGNGNGGHGNGGPGDGGHGDGGHGTGGHGNGH